MGHNTARDGNARKRGCAECTGREWKRHKACGRSRKAPEVQWKQAAFQKWLEDCGRELECRDECRKELELGTRPWVSG